MTELIVANALRSLGMVPARVAAYGQTSTIAHLPRTQRPRAWSPTLPVAAIPLLLWCDGAVVPETAAHAALGRHFGTLLTAGLLTVKAQLVRAPFAVVPIEHGFVCFDFDNDDAAIEVPGEKLGEATADARVCWPDDSSHHLIGALPAQLAPRVARWLDVGSGPAFAPLLRPRIANQIIATDINPRALTMANLGVGLSNLSHIQPLLADGVPTTAGMFELITCNAPIPAPVHAASWHFAPPQVLQEFLRVAPTYLQPAGTIILHALLSAHEVEQVQRQGGTAQITGYTDAARPPNPGPGFAVVWWQPHRPGPCTSVHRELSTLRPHIDALDQPTWWAQAA